MRTIGIRHRRKRTAEGEARPTMVAIKDGEKIAVHELEDDTAELDFVRGMFPVAWRSVERNDDQGESIAQYQQRHCRWRLVRADEDPAFFPPHHRRQRDDDRVEAVTQVPTAFEGMRDDDRVAMLMGGSGDRLAAALSRRGEEVNARVYRIPPFTLKDHRGTATKDDDQLTLIRLLEEWPQLFFQLRRRDRDLIRVTEAFRLRQDALKARIACEQRVDQRFIGRIFLSEEGRYPEGRIEDQADAQKANDHILMSMVLAETEQDKQMDQAVKALDVWQEVLQKVEGCGPRIAAGIIASIGIIQRFWVEPDTEEMARLYQRSQRLERDGKFEEDLDKIQQPNPPNRYEALHLVRNWKQTHGKETEARLLEEAIMSHQGRSRLRMRALTRGASKLKAYCGVHVLRGGKHAEVPPEQSFPRRRGGHVANWSAFARQSLYLLADQFNRRPKSIWGQKLLQNKKRLRERHPESVEVNGKKRYTDGHIHRMGLWRTITRFVEWLFREWTKLEEAQRGA